MLLDVETLYNDSKKISELRKRTTITKHQENSWIPMAQYNSRTNTYVNAAINLQAITSYNIQHAYSYIAQEFGTYWAQIKNVGDQTYHSAIGYSISNSGIANNILSYTFTYTVHHLDWQIVDGSYIPEYYAPVHPDTPNEESLPMEVPDYSTLFPVIPDEPEEPEENNEDNELENNE